MKNSFANDSLHANAYHQRPPHHPFRENLRGCISNAVGIMALPCPKGKPGLKGVYPASAMGWKQFDRTWQHGAMFEMAFHIFSHVLELNGFGTPTFIGRSGSSSVREAQVAYLRALEGRPKKTDRHTLSTTTPGKGIRHDIRFDQAVAEVLHGIASGQFDGELEREGRRNDADNDDLADGMEAQLGGGGGGGRRGGRRNDADADDEAIDDDDEDDPFAELDRKIREVLDANLHDCEGQHIVEKIQIIVTQLTRPILDGKGDPIPGREEDAGCIIFFCIMDPLYSMGKAVDRLIELCEDHRAMKLGTRAGANVFAGDAIGQDNNSANGRGRNGYQQSRTSRLMEIFPWLADEDHANNTLHTLDRAAYLQLVAFIRDDPSLALGEERQRALTRGLADPGTIGNPNKLHPINVFTPEWACNVMQMYGVPAERCSIGFFRGDPNWEFNEAERLAGGQVNPDWYFPPRDSWWMLQEGWVWARRGYAGLSSQYFPWTKIPEPLLKLTALRTESNALTAYEGNSANNVLACNYTEAMIAQGIGILTPLPIVPYDPHAMNRHNAIFQVASENSRVMQQIKGPRDPENQREAYAAYCREMEEHRNACMMRMQHVLVPTSHIPPSMKHVLTWMSQNVRKVSTHLPMITMDPYNATPETLEMDPFAHFMLREALDIRYARHVAVEVRHWQMTHWGAMDCYSSANLPLHYSVIYHGPSQTGKSFMVKDATINTCIENTVSSLLESSNRSFNTHDDYMGVIMFKDELDNVYVSTKAAENDKSGTAERIKSMMTDHKTTYRVLVFVDAANGRQKRVAEEIESLFHATMLCCTNKKVGGGDEAIASRFLNFVMTRADCNLYEFMGIKDRLDTDDSQYNDDLKHSWRVKQGLLAIAQCLIDSEVIPEPSMEAYDFIHMRCMAYLQEHGINTQEIRPAQMCRRLARIYVILNALIILYDMPGAKFAGADFDISQLRELTPYLYCTKQIAMFTMTQTGEIYIHPVRTTVLSGVFQVCQFPYKKNLLIEDYLRADIGKKIPWKENTNHTTDVITMDYNYIAVRKQSYDVVMKALSQVCVPRLGTNEIESELDTMTKVFIKVRRVMGQTKTAYQSVKEETINHFPIRREEMETSIPVVMKNVSAGELYVAVEAMDKFHEDILIEALGTCIHDKFRPQTFLLGTTAVKPHPAHPEQMHQYNGLYRTLEITPEVIDALSLGTKITAPDVTYLPYSVQTIMSGLRRHPDKQAVAEMYAEQRVKRTNPLLEIREDLDDWAHRQHHWKSACTGTPEQSPARPLTIMNTARAALFKIERMHDLNDMKPIQERKNLPIARSLRMQYPDEILEANDFKIIADMNSRGFGKILTDRNQVWKLEMEEYKKLSPEERAETPAPILATLATCGDRVKRKYIDGIIVNEEGEEEGPTRKWKLDAGTYVTTQRQLEQLLPDARLRSSDSRVRAHLNMWYVDQEDLSPAQRMARKRNNAIERKTIAEEARQQEKLDRRRLRTESSHLALPAPPSSSSSSSMSPMLSRDENDEGNRADLRATQESLMAMLSADVAINDYDEAPRTAFNLDDDDDDGDGMDNFDFDADFQIPIPTDNREEEEDVETTKKRAKTATTQKKKSVQKRTRPPLVQPLVEIQKDASLSSSSSNLLPPPPPGSVTLARKKKKKKKRSKTQDDEEAGGSSGVNRVSRLLEESVSGSGWAD